MKSLDLRDADGDRLTLADIEDDRLAVPIQGRPEALLRVFPYTLTEREAAEVLEDGVAVLIDAEAAADICNWLARFFRSGTVTLTRAEALALRADLKAHAVADVRAQLELLGTVHSKLDEAVG